MTGQPGEEQVSLCHAHLSCAVVITAGNGPIFRGVEVLW